MSDFVNANVLIRLLTKDDPEKSRRALALLQEAERGERQLVTSEAVIAEVVYVLASRSLYRTPRSELVLRLRAVLGNRGLRLDHKDAVLRALALYGSTNLHFVDCLCVAHVEREKLDGLYSYDRGSDGVPGLRRREP